MNEYVLSDFTSFYETLLSIISRLAKQFYRSLWREFNYDTKYVKKFKFSKDKISLKEVNKEIKG